MEYELGNLNDNQLPKHKKITCLAKIKDSICNFIGKPNRSSSINLPIRESLNDTPKTNINEEPLPVTHFLSNSTRATETFDFMGNFIGQQKKMHNSAFNRSISNSKNFLYNHRALCVSK